MSQADTPVPIAALLTHRAWVRRLARSMVRDDASADDVEQRTWLAALRSPPQREVAGRAWLARVVRSTVFNAHRDGTRRARHEAAARRGEAVRSAAEVVADAESHRLLVTAVLALEEPYRTAVLLRFFEGLAPRVIAARTGVPVETVRTRLRRALATLRDRLGGGRGREAWLAALAPIVGVRPEGVSAAAALTGGTIMTGKATLFAATLAVAIAAGYAGGSAAGGGDSDRGATNLESRLGALETALASVRESREAGGSASSSAVRRAARADDVAGDGERRLAALEAEVAELRRTGGASASGAARTASSGTEGSAGAGAEPSRLQALTTPELLAELRLKSSSAARPDASRSDGEAALSVAEVLRERSLDPAERAEAWFCEARAQRAAGNAAEEEAAYKKALEVAGPDSQMGRLAATQLGWVASRNRDPRGAAEWFLSVARQPGTPPRERAWTSYVAANLLSGTGDAGDRDRAREHYRAVVDAFAASDDEEAKKTAELCRKALAKMDDSGR